MFCFAADEYICLNSNGDCLRSSHQHLAVGAETAQKAQPIRIQHDWQPWRIRVQVAEPIGMQETDTIENEGIANFKFRDLSLFFLLSCRYS